MSRGALQHQQPNPLPDTNTKMMYSIEFIMYMLCYTDSIQYKFSTNQTRFSQCFHILLQTNGLQFGWQSARDRPTCGDNRD